LSGKEFFEEKIIYSSEKMNNSLGKMIFSLQKMNYSSGKIIYFLLKIAF